MNVNMLHINFQPKQLWIADEKLKCLIHGLELRRGFFPLLFSFRCARMSNSSIMDVGNESVITPFS